MNPGVIILSQQTINLINNQISQMLEISPSIAWKYLKSKGRSRVDMVRDTTRSTDQNINITESINRIVAQMLYDMKSIEQ